MPGRPRPDRRPLARSDLPEAPLVEAEPHARWLIVLWTVVACAVAGVGYAIVRATQSRDDPKSD